MQAVDNFLKRSNCGADGVSRPAAPPRPSDRAFPAAPATPRAQVRGRGELPRRARRRRRPVGGGPCAQEVWPHGRRRANRAGLAPFGKFELRAGPLGAGRDGRRAYRRQRGLGLGRPRDAVFEALRGLLGLVAFGRCGGGRGHGRAVPLRPREPRQGGAGAGRGARGPELLGRDADQ